MNKRNYLLPFILITSLFFLWGFAHNLDPILIPHLKKSFTLTTTQSTLVDSAVFIAYFLMALPAGFIMKRFGYKNGIITGLLFFAVGCFLFIPAANTQSYFFFLFALFVIACGLTILETAANPYAASLGPAESSTQRLNLAQSFNGLAAFLAPVIGARVIFTKGNSEAELGAMTEQARKIALASEASSVKTPYFILGAVLVLIAVVFAFTKLPKIQNSVTENKSKSIFHAFKHRHLTWAVIAQFFYIGAQVSVFSLFILYATKSADVGEIKAADYLGACGLAFLIGRFLGTFLMKFIAPPRLLALYAAASVLLCIVAMTAHGIITVYTVIGICFFMSIMFPTIFSLGIQKLGADTEYGSSLIIMSIVGGAILPRLFGYISDATGNIQYGYIVPLICFLVVVYFGLKGYKPKLSYDKILPDLKSKERPNFNTTV
ncbi:MAG TPA: L-fucose:H+ symporter permease [Chitinophagaceae bacterium]|nr:L-fucose:H+ symporter permease [Chitinophagaceae bacterium]